MSEFGIKLPTKAGWDVAGKPHQLVSYAQQPETNKHHLTPFFAGKKDGEGGHTAKPTTPLLICSQMAILKCHASVHIVEFHSPPFPPILLSFASLNH